MKPDTAAPGRLGRAYRAIRSLGLCAVNGVLALTALTAQAVEPLRSGFDTMSEPIQAMQRDDDANPGMLSVLQGRAIWSRDPAPAKPSCAACHGELKTSMRGVAARYPRWDEALQRPIDLSGRIKACQERHQQMPASGSESPQRLALTAAVAQASRGMPLSPDPDPRLAPSQARGQALFTRRIGQLDLSCAHCHDAAWGQRLGGSLIPQGHPNGYPLYRLQWQALGSLQRRLRNCLTGVRAQPWPADAPEYVEIELYLVSRAAGLMVETPAVRP